MRLERAILTLILAVMWLGMPVHCQIEAVSAAALFDCDKETDCTSSNDAGCQDDFCDSIESAGYLLSRADDLVTGPMLLVVQVTEEATVEPGAIHEPQHVPIPLLHSGWQFACRTAGLPRAPSFLA